MKNRSGELEKLLRQTAQAIRPLCGLSDGGLDYQSNGWYKNWLSFGIGMVMLLHNLCEQWWSLVI
jgi:hypothetical protein